MDRRLGTLESKFADIIREIEAMIRRYRQGG